MANARRNAIALMVIGALIPLLLIPLLSGYKAGAGWFSNLMNLKIAFGSSLAVPYRFVLAVCLFIIFLGVRQLDLLRSGR